MWQTRLKKDPENAAGQKDCSLAAPRDVTRFGLLNIEGVRESGEETKKVYVYVLLLSITFGVARPNTTSRSTVPRTDIKLCLAVVGGDRGDGVSF
jgi:hypothetical protein